MKLWRVHIMDRNICIKINSANMTAMSVAIYTSLENVSPPVTQEANQIIVMIRTIHYRCLKVQTEIQTGNVPVQGCINH